MDEFPERKSHADDPGTAEPDEDFGGTAGADRLGAIGFERGEASVEFGDVGLVAAFGIADLLEDVVEFARDELFELGKAPAHDGGMRFVGFGWHVS